MTWRNAGAGDYLAAQKVIGAVKANILPEDEAVYRLDLLEALGPATALPASVLLGPQATA